MCRTRLPLPGLSAVCDPFLLGMRTWGGLPVRSRSQSRTCRARSTRADERPAGPDWWDGPRWGSFVAVEGVPVVVHRPSASDGRLVTVRRHGRERILGLAHSDQDLIVFLEAAGVVDPESILDDPRWLEWRGGPAHQ